MAALAKFLTDYGKQIWLAFSIPTFVLALAAAIEGNRTVLQSINEGNRAAPGARLLRYVGTVVSICVACFILVGIIAWLPQTPQNLQLRIVVGTLSFFIVPVLLGTAMYRVYRFVTPERR